MLDQVFELGAEVRVRSLAFVALAGERFSRSHLSIMR